MTAFEACKTLSDLLQARTFDNSGFSAKQSHSFCIRGTLPREARQSNNGEPSNHSVVQSLITVNSQAVNPIP